MYTGLFVILLVFTSLPGCDTAEEGVETRTFRVEYRVEGTFAGCALFYITRHTEVKPEEVNRGGEVVHGHEVLPWTTAFEVTVAPDKAFVARVDASCTAAGAETVLVSLYVDGTLREQAESTDVEAVASVALALTLDG